MTYNYVQYIRDGNLSSVEANITTTELADYKNSFEDYPINAAARFRQQAILECLVGLSANINALSDNGYSALHWAVVNEDSTMVDYLITNSANINLKQNCSGIERINHSMQCAALHLASIRNLATITQSLIDAGANTDLQNKIGNTALHMSSTRDHTVIAQKLITAGADKTIINDDGATALDLSTSEEITTILT